MIGYKAKVERALKKEELADYLRELADSLEADASKSCDLQLACYDKVDLSLKMSGEQAYVRIKMRSFGEQGSPDVKSSAPSVKSGKSPSGAYKPLKKNMKDDFKAIFKAIHQDSLPPADIMESFLSDARNMATFPGKGDEHYPRFLEACDDFAEAFAQDDMPRMRQLVDDLNHMKTECHARFK